MRVGAFTAVLCPARGQRNKGKFTGISPLRARAALHAALINGPLTGWFLSYLIRFAFCKTSLLAPPPLFIPGRGLGAKTKQKTRTKPSERHPFPLPKNKGYTVPKLTLPQKGPT